MQSLICDCKLLVANEIKKNTSEINIRSMFYLTQYIQNVISTYTSNCEWQFYTLLCVYLLPLEQMSRPVGPSFRGVGWGWGQWSVIKIKGWWGLVLEVKGEIDMGASGCWSGGLWEDRHLGWNLPKGQEVLPTQRKSTSGKGRASAKALGWGWATLL